MRYIDTSPPFGAAWGRLKTIAKSDYPASYARLLTFEADGASLTRWLNDAGDGYYIRLEHPGFTPDLELPLAALARDRRAFEIADAHRLAQIAARGELSVDYARSMADGFGYEAFNAEFSTLRDQRKKAGKKKGDRFGLRRAKEAPATGEPLT